MSEIYRVPPWLMLEHWRMSFDPADKPNGFVVSILSERGEHSGKGVSIAHAAKNAFKNRQRNEKTIPAKGHTLPSEDQTEEDQSEDGLGLD